MNQTKNHRSILVISHNSLLTDLTHRAVDNTVSVDYASNEIDGLSRIREKLSDVIVLGDLGSRESVFKYYQELREGWISRHAAILIIEPDITGNSFRLLTDKDLDAGIKESDYAAVDTFLIRLKEVLSEKLKARENKLKLSIINPDSFCVTWEQIPGPGAFEIRQELVLENARKAARSGKVCAISIVDNPGGNPAIATEILCSEIRKFGIEPMVHLAFRDRNRNQVESLLYQLAALDINNLLVLTGDYPSNLGFHGKSKPVFDIDSINGLLLISEMNRGIEHEIMRRKTRLAPTEFFTGVAISPFKQQEAEVMGQYYKLKKKIDAGADFAITQIGYDARKWHELKMWLQIHNYDFPILTSIQVLSYPAAKAMHENRVPGCVVTDKLLMQIGRESESPDKGKSARLERAAKMYAVSRGMGFKGACISGQTLNYSDVEYIIDRGRELTSTWTEFLPEFDYPQDKGFYYFEKDLRTNMNTNVPAGRIQKGSSPVIYLLSRVIHYSLFEHRSPLYQPTRKLMQFIHSKRWLEKPFHSVEYWIKAMLYGCKDCGDCALYDVAFLCPVSQCPKDQRNAPCGGSYLGWCEVYPFEKQCIWVRAYKRLKTQHKEDSIGENIVPPCNWELWQTSSWVNYFTGRDHVSRRIGARPSNTQKNTESLE